MRKTTKQFLMSLYAKAHEAGITNVIAFTEENLKERESVFTAEQMEKHIDEHSKNLCEYMCKERFVPCPDNWKLISPHWYKQEDNSGTRYSFEDINRLFILHNESK